MKNVILKSPLETWKHITNHSARKTLVKRLKQNNVAKSEIIVQNWIMEMRNSSRLYPMQLIIVALKFFPTDSTSIHQMIHEF